MASVLTDHTFRDTGITVKIRKISPMLAADIRNSIPAPIPPENEVDYGPPKGKVKEQNVTDPNYLTQVTEWNLKVYMLWRRVMVLRAVDQDSLPAGWNDEVKGYRDFIKAQTGKDLDEPEDLVIYILRICVGSEEDLNDFINAVTRRSQPTAEVIEQAKASF